MIFIPIHITHRVKRKVDMRDSGILVDGVGGFVALGEVSGNLVGGVEDVLHAVYVAGGERNDEVVDPDTLILSEGSGGLGHLVGGGGDAFYPTQKAIRAHVIQTIYNMVGRPAVEFSDAFADVKQYAEHANAVSWAVQNGVLTESADGMLKPTEETSREEVMVYLHRYLGSPGADGKKLNEFADADAVSDYAQEAVAWAVEEELLVTQNGEIRPLDSITRAELASLLVRFYERFMRN